MFVDQAVLLPHIEAGKLRALAVTSAARMTQLAQVPTAEEVNFPKLRATLWSGILAPAATPSSIIHQLNTAINEALRTPETRASFVKLGAEPLIMSAEEFATLIAAETKKWGDVIRTADIKMD
jgi:tripartite-type tricarboxylate transporter receptor subunit TctC